MHPELSVALKPLLHDLAAAAGVQPELRDQSWHDVSEAPDLPEMASCYLFAADGSGMGVRIEFGTGQVSQVVELADQVQEWAVEALWSMGAPASWPPCPHHPARHPLEAVKRDGRALWVCPVLAVEVAEVGALPSGEPSTVCSKG